MLQKIRFTRWVKLAIYLGALLLVNGMTWLVTSINQKGGLYPVDADSIGIPVMSTISTSLFIFLILFVITLLTKTSFLIELKSKGIARFMAVRIALLMLYAVVLLFAVYGVAYWSFPDHYLIAVSYLVLFVVLLTGLFFDWRGMQKGSHLDN